MRFSLAAIVALTAAPSAFAAALGPAPTAAPQLVKRVFPTGSADVNAFLSTVDPAQLSTYFSWAANGDSDFISHAQSFTSANAAQYSSYLAAQNIDPAQASAILAGVQNKPTIGGSAAAAAATGTSGGSAGGSSGSSATGSSNNGVAAGSSSTDANGNVIVPVSTTDANGNVVAASTTDANGNIVAASSTITGGAAAATSLSAAGTAGLASASDSAGAAGASPTGSPANGAVSTQSAFPVLAAFTAMLATFLYL